MHKKSKYLRSIMKELGFPQQGPTPIYEDNRAAILMINNKVPTSRSRHIDIQHFAIQEWRGNGGIVMKHIPGIICPPDGLTKPLGWILHSRHARRLMGHYVSKDSSSTQEDDECKSLRPPSHPSPSSSDCSTVVVPDPTSETRGGC